uniref:Cullin N-terminal domain-containing protein n=1 Tax=Nelumbo nucifera TaxID=4432 RepID=A0A822YC34_NELNU|nr:TPA_asm: hypothetical protein HUJ06_031618 [Nelumbo nucifera]
MVSFAPAQCLKALNCPASLAIVLQECHCAKCQQPSIIDQHCHRIPTTKNPRLLLLHTHTWPTAYRLTESTTSVSIRCLFSQDFRDIGVSGIELYENDFEVYMLENTSVYYARKALDHILVDSCPDYMLMVEQCLKIEKERVSHCLCPSTKQKLLEVKDMSRIYNFFSRIIKGLEPVSTIFREHVVSIGQALVRDAAEEASHKKVGQLLSFPRPYSSIL